MAQFKSSDISSMDPRRDYRTYTDWALDAFIKRFPSHPDHSLAVSEAERRLKDREQNREAKDKQPDVEYFSQVVQLQLGQKLR